MNETYYNFLITEINRIQKLGGKNIVINFSLKNNESISCNPFNADGTYFSKPTLNDGVLQFVEPYTEPVTLSETAGGTKIITKITGTRKHIALSEIAKVEITFDILQETTVEPIIPPVESEETAE